MSVCTGCGNRKQRDGTMWYLVKWRDLPYDQATWEREDNDIVDMKLYVENYENLRYCALYLVCNLLTTHLTELVCYVLCFLIGWYTVFEW